MGDFAGILGILAIIVWFLATTAAVVTCAVLLASVGLWFSICMIMVYAGLTIWTSYVFSETF